MCFINEFKWISTKLIETCSTCAILWIYELNTKIPFHTSSCLTNKLQSCRKWFLQKKRRKIKEKKSKFLVRSLFLSFFLCHLFLHRRHVYKLRHHDAALIFIFAILSHRKVASIDQVKKKKLTLNEKSQCFANEKLTNDIKYTKQKSTNDYNKNPSSNARSTENCAYVIWNMTFYFGFMNILFPFVTFNCLGVF